MAAPSINQKQRKKKATVGLTQDDDGEYCCFVKATARTINQEQAA
jgi:hypothetical protein